MKLRSLVFLILFFPSVLMASSEVKVITFYAPPLIGESDIAPDGIAVELLKAVLSGSNFKPVIVTYPRPRANMAFYNHAGELYLGSSQALDQHRRRELVGIPLMAIPNLIFYKKSQFPHGFSWSEYPDLKPYRIGVLRGGSSEKTASRAQLNYEDVTSLEQLFRKLDSNRTNLVSVFDLSGWTTLHKLYPARLAEFAACDNKLFSTAELQATLFINGPRTQALVTAIRQGLLRIYLDGRWLAIMEKYYSKEHIPPASLRLIQAYLGQEAMKSDGVP